MHHVEHQLLAATAAARSSIDGELSALRSELRQVRSLLADAFGILQQSFRELDELTRAQSSFVRSLVASGAPSPPAADGLVALVAELGRLLQRFVVQADRRRESGAQIARQNEHLVSELESVFKLLSQIDDIATETHMLSINAAIEAARSSESGKAFGVVAAEVRNLSKNSKRLNELVVAQVERSRASVNGARALVNEMVTDDSGGRSQTDALLARVDDVNRTMAHAMTQLAGLAERVRAAVGDAVRALQCDDITSQVLACAERRLDKLAAVAAALAAFGDGDLGADGFERASASLREQCAIEVISVASQSVAEQGEVVLF
jgi:methyl-accepting chemotaxis protein